MAQYFSKRNLPLITQYPVGRMLTAEDYLKWYELYVVDAETQTVQAVSFDETHLLDGWRDHCIVPASFHALAQALGCTYDSATMAAVCQHFVTNHLDGDWTQLASYLPRETASQGDSLCTT